MTVENVSGSISMKEWEGAGSNPRPRDLQADVLLTALTARYIYNFEKAHSDHLSLSEVSCSGCTLFSKRVYNFEKAMHTVQLLG